MVFRTLEVDHHSLRYISSKIVARILDPVSLAFYYMWYAGIDVSKHPDMALSAVSNGHVSPSVAIKLSDILNFSNLPRNLQHSNLPNIPNGAENKKAQVSIVLF